MATKEKNKQKTKKKLLWVGLGILAAGILAFGGAFVFGALLLARDLLYLALFADALLIGGTLGKVAVDSIADKVSDKKQAAELSRERSRVQEIEQEKAKNKENEVVFELGEKPTSEDISKIVKNMEPVQEDMNVPGQIVMEFDEPTQKTIKEKNQPKKR